MAHNAFGLLSAVALFAAACEAAPAPIRSDCQPEFPYLQGWLGGDAASSAVVLNPNPAVEETLWFFGDTFVGAPGAIDRKGSAFVHNTVARSRCDAKNGWAIKYGWADREGRHASVFVPSTREADFYWPLASSSVNGIPYVLLARTALVEVDGTETFAVVGTDIARISNPRAEFANWEIQYSTLVDDGALVPASAAIASGDYLYVAGYIPGGDDFTVPRFMSRIPIATLQAFDGHLGRSLEIWTGTEWAVGGTPKVLMDDAATEMGIQRLPRGCGWIVSYQSPIQPGDAGFSDNIYVRTARRLEGPWSGRRLLARTPEMNSASAAPGTVCYAAKLQPQFGNATRLMVTYVCSIWPTPEEDDNLGSRDTIPARGRPNEAITVLDAMDVYVPRALSLRFPKPTDEPGLVNECPWLIE